MYSFYSDLHNKKEKQIFLLLGECYCIDTCRVKCDFLPLVARINGTEAANEVSPCR